MDPANTDRHAHMRFQDNKLWVVWPLLFIFEAAILYVTYEICKDIAQRPLQWKDAYTTVIGVNLLWQVLAGMLLWCAFHSLSIYEIGAEGIQCRVFPSRNWTVVPWSELTYGGLYSRWTGETENFIYFSNYQFNGNQPKASMNDGDAKYMMFTIPLSKRGLKAIRMYVPDNQLRLLVDSPWLWKSNYSKKLNAVFEERGLLQGKKTIRTGKTDSMDGETDR